MKYIELTQGKRAVVDDDMFEELSKHKWHFGEGYARRAEYKNGWSRLVRMHHAVLPRPVNLFVDHINGDKLDNRRCNLRLVTKSQNMMNVGNRANTKSGFKGVSLFQKGWKAYINKDRKQIHLGCFNTPEKAAQAYNDAALKYHGEYARLNPL